ncbi:hypothetical protein BD408DRAFT_452710 [Parasitella parasitica]|nr:hypothetical protein BD408DRAFT_452710 [Parasitella parasitica]
MSPYMEFARLIPSRRSTFILQLQQKLAFLLSMAAFMRPSDLAQITFASCQVDSILAALKLRWLLPKRNARNILYCSSKSNNIRKPLAAATISSWLHKHFISKSIAESRLSIRSLASSSAMESGIQLDDLVTLGNWASSDALANHYQRNHMTTIDFTSTTLSASTTEGFFDAAASFE